MPSITEAQLRDIRRLYKCGATPDEIRETIPHEEPLESLIDGIDPIKLSNRDQECRREYFIRRWVIKARYNHQKIAKRDPRYVWQQR